MQSEIQIVDTHESLETRFNIGFYAIMFQFNRTLLICPCREPFDKLRTGLSVELNLSPFALSLSKGCQ